MPFISLLLCVLFIVSNLLVMCFFNKKHYWKILLATSLLFFFLLTPLGLLILLYISFLSYYFSKIIIKSYRIKWWVILLILLPLILNNLLFKNILFSNYYNNLKNNDFDILNLLGLSFITFNALSYLIDLKRKYIDFQNNFLKLLLYLAFFPIIFSGPITRAKHFFNEIKYIEFKKQSINRGLRLISWGIFKNMVVGSMLLTLFQLLIAVNLSGVFYLILGYVFFLYLYFTFSSLIHIFQGISLIFNINLKDNFKPRIYFSTSRENFWKGWHMSLNNWFRDYFFYEIIKLDIKRKFTHLFLFITFIFIALWHDFTLVFLIWGTLNAIWLIAERKLKKYFTFMNKYTIIGVLYHSFIASFLACIFFSEDIFTLFKTLSKVDFNSINISYLISKLKFIFLLIIILVFTDFIEKKTISISLNDYIEKKPTWFRYTFYYMIILMILYYSVDFKFANIYNLF